MIESFYYKLGPVETTKVWYSPIPIEKVNGWIKDFKKLDLGEYEVYLGGKYVIDPINTDDVDICITGPIYDYMKLYEIMKESMNLALNKHNFFLDIKHYDNLDFFKYPKTEGFKRYHIMTELAGEEIKKIDGEIVHQSFKKTNIPNSHWIPTEFAVNVVIFPMDKQIEDGRIYNPIKLN
tara:strand:+ start:100 stop:636 length:537 start_codon:yes stop_codon:yes gene_type:complete